MQVSTSKSKLPSRSRFMAQVNNYVPSNMYKPTQKAATASLQSTSSKTFNQNIFPQESLSATLKRESEKSLSMERTAKSNKESKKKSRLKREESKNSEGEGRKMNKKSSLFSGSSSSFQFSPMHSQNIKRPLTGDEVPKSKEPKHKRESKSVADAKRLLPGNYEYPEVLYKGVFQNNYMMADTIEVKDQEMYELPVRNSHKFYEEQYNLSMKRNEEAQTSHKYLEGRLSLIKLIETDGLDPLQQDRRKITMSENFNNSQNYLNPNFLPNYVDSDKIPGQAGSIKIVSTREISALSVQKLVRGFITRRRVARMKQTLKKHFDGEKELDPYELEFFDMNVPIFKQILANNGKLPLKNTKKATTMDSDMKEQQDPNRGLLSNTFASVLRSNFFPEDPMDYVLLAELREDKDALFPKLLQEEEKQKSKEVMLAKKYEYLFGKPSIAREIKTDNMSVISKFLTTNLDKISDSDLKFTKFQTDYKSTIKPKPKPAATTSASLFGKPFGASVPVNKNQKFDTQPFAGKNKEHEIQSEISEDYPDDFDGDSAIKESIIRDSIVGGDSRGKDGYINDSIRESIIEQSSPGGKYDKRYSSNRSISEDIIAESIKLNKNRSERSIQEEIPISESINTSDIKPKPAKKNNNNIRKKSEEISEDIDYKDSYGDEEFESLAEESIQESIEKFQSMRKGSTSTPSRPTISPQKVVEDRTLASKPVFRKSTQKEEEISPISKNPAPIQSTTQKAITVNKITEFNKEKEKKAAEERVWEVPEERSYHYEEKPEERRRYLDSNILDIPPSNKADILFANFQKEMEKMMYVESMTQNVKNLENTIENLYNQKEINLLHSLQKSKIADSFKVPGRNLNNVPAPNPATADSNSFVFLMQKYNTMERSMAQISKQLNFLINNFTGANPSDVLSQSGSSGSQRKPRPIVPVRRTPSTRKTEPSVSVSTEPIKKAEPEVKYQSTVTVPKPKENIVQKFEKIEKVEKVEKVEKIEEKIEKPQVLEIPTKKEEVVFKKEETPLKKIETVPTSKPKFSFKLPTSQPANTNKSFEEISDKEAKEEKERKEKETNKPAFIVPLIDKKPVETKPEPVPVKVEKTPLVVEEKASNYKSNKFSKWQQESSSEGISEEIVEDLEEEKPQATKEVKKEKSSEEEVDFSAKEYSESFEKPSPMITPKRSIPPKFLSKEPENILPQESSSVKAYSESFEELTPKSNNKKIVTPLKTETKKSEATQDDIEELIIDEDIDLPSDNDTKEEIKAKPVIPPKVEPKQAVVQTKPKEEEFEKVDESEGYGDDDFEELSLASETKEEPLAKPTKSPINQKPALEPVEIKPKPTEIKTEAQHFQHQQHEESESGDIEASQDNSTISWQDEFIPGQSPVKVEHKVFTFEKKPIIVDEVSTLSPSKDLSPKKQLSSPLGELKLKGKHLMENQNINIHQENSPTHSPEKDAHDQQMASEEMKHNEHTNKIKNDLKTIVDKMNIAKKEQIVQILIHHLHNATPDQKLVIFDKAPVKDTSIIDAYNEIFYNLFRSEFRKLNNEFANIKEVETRMQFKLKGLITKSRDILQKKVGQTHGAVEDYKSLGNNFNNIYETLRNKKIAGEEDDFYEEEDDIKRLVEEENNKLKEAVADDVMETLFEETIRDLMRIAQSRKMLK